MRTPAVVASSADVRQKLSSAFLALLISLPPVPDAALAFQEPPAVAVEARQASTATRAAVDATATLTADADLKTASKAPSRSYINLTGFPFPLGPFFERKTVMTDIVPGKVYGFEQEIRLSGISANVRSTVFRMRDNHLLVYNPVAPTEEFMQQLQSLDHAGVSHILLGATQYEHKIFVGPFARRFPNAKVWAVPDQWSFPVNLPAPLLGIDTKGTGGGELLDTATGSNAYANAPDLTAEFEVKLLRPPERLGFGYAANEAAVLHKDSKTLALTDALVNVPAKPTAVYDEGNLLAIGDNGRNTGSLGMYILKAAGAVNWRGTASQDVETLYSASDRAPAEASAAVMQRGWERNALLSLYFGPSPKTLVDPDASFQDLADKWIVAPVTDTLIYRSDRIRPEITRWIDDVAKWDFNMISPSHFMARPGTPEDVRKAFAPTIAKAGDDSAKRPFADGDVKLLDDIAGALKAIKII